jgi:hypothetical protein
MWCHFPIFDNQTTYMKKLLLSIFVIITAFSAKAQFNVYHPFPDSNAYWGEETEFSTGGPLVVNDFGYKLSGDTLLNGRIYHKIYKVGGISTSGPVTPYRGFYAGLREDSLKHVYVCCTSMNKNDTLYYDYNMQLGDTLKQINSASQGFFGPEKNYVSKIDSALIDGSYRKRFIISAFANGSQRIVTAIIEGIGSIEGLLEPMTLLEGTSSVICFQQNGIVMFSSNSYFYRDTCIVFGPVGVNEINNDVHVFNIYPNPASARVTLSYQLNNNNAVLKLYNTMGQLLESRTINNSDGTIEDNVSALPGGVYYYTLSVDGVVEATNKLAIIR